MADPTFTGVEILVNGDVVRPCFQGVEVLVDGYIVRPCFSGVEIIIDETVAPITGRSTTSRLLLDLL